MGSTALQIITEAYRKHNLDEVTSFSTSLEFPFNIAKDVLNDVIRFVNRLGPYWFQQKKDALTYSGGVYTYSFSTLGVDPKRILYIRKEATNHQGELIQYNERKFLNAFRRSAIQTAEPTAWKKFADTLELNTIPDQDYSMYVYHLKDIPVVTATSDTFNVPTTDEDILINACFNMLGYYLGKMTLSEAQGAIQLLWSPFLADMKQDSGMPTQMPAAF